MKLKSLLAIVSCSAIALSISLPSVAETVRNSKVEPASIGIGNKDYRNKQSTSSMVGNWKSSVVDNEYKHVNPTEINIDIKSDSTITYAFQTKNGNSFRNHTYKYLYAPNGTGIWIQNLSEGTTTISSIKWISDNEFVQTLIKDSGHPERSGLQRRYIRQQEPVATILQQRAQQAAARREQQQKLRETQIQYDGVSGSWPQFWDASGSIDTTPLSP